MSVNGTRVSRREVLRWSATAGVLATAGPLISSCAGPVGSLPGTDANGLVLLPGFSSRIVAQAGEYVGGLSYRAFPDGAATFADPATPGGWYHTINHEIPGGLGGVTSIRYAPDGTILSASSICSDTTLNCAGGATPWGTWLTCEEFEGGRVWECDPTGLTPTVVRPALGTFQHEAAVVAADGRLYLTEDRPDSGFYRFTPTLAGDLSAGSLEIATGPSAVGTVTWVAVPDPTAWSTPCRRQVPASIKFDGGEGIDSLGTTVLFTTKGDNRVWGYDTATSQMTIRYQAGGPSPLSGVDNLWIDDPSGTFLVAEDGGDMEVVMIRPDNTAQAIVRIPGHEGSEVTGPCFSPDGSRLYFSSQRAPVGPFGIVLGVTYEVTGPFDSLLGRP